MTQFVLISGNSVCTMQVCFLSKVSAILDSTYLFVYLINYNPLIYLSIYFFTYTYLYLSIYFFTYTFLYLSIYFFTYTYLYLSRLHQFRCCGGRRNYFSYGICLSINLINRFYNILIYHLPMQMMSVWMQWLKKKLLQMVQ